MTQLEPVDPTIADLDAALDEAVVPVLRQLDQLDKLRALRVAELARLDASLKRAERVLAALDPERAAARNPRRSGQKKAGVVRSSRERDAKKKRVEEYVRARPGEDLIASSLNGDLEGISAAMLRELLAELADEGVLRLDRRGIGGSTIYRLVAA